MGRNSYYTALMLYQESKNARISSLNPIDERAYAKELFLIGREDGLLSCGIITAEQKLYFKTEYSGDVTKTEGYKNGFARGKQLAKQNIAPKEYLIKKIIIEGLNARMNAELYNPQRYENIEEQNAYFEGFILHGTRKLSDNLKNLSPEELYNIGYNDCISGIGINTLLEPIKINKQYLEGYKKALQSEQAIVFGPPKPKHR